MWTYIIRRILYAIPILVCVNVFTFALFFFVNTPDDVAYFVLGDRHVKPVAVYRWKHEHQYHLPRLLNLEDRIVVFAAADALPNVVTDQLDGYSVEFISLQAVGDERRAEINQGRIRSRTRTIKGNVIVVVIPDGISAETAKFMASEILVKAVPFLVVDTGSDNAREIFPDAVIGVIHADGLREAVDREQVGGLRVVTETLFFKKSVQLFWFSFGKSDRENVDIGYQIKSRMGASLMITVPAFFLGLALNIVISMIVAFCRGSYIDRGVLIVCIALMSIVLLFYIFSSQLLFGKWLKLFPISGYQPGFDAVRFILLPVIISVFAGVGPGVRFYRTVFLEEVNRDYIRTARAKGLGEPVVLFKHALKNSMLPILTNAVVVIPTLFIGSLLLESFFAIPGLGGFTLEGIQAQDFRIVGSMVYLGSFLYIVGLILTDISYTLFDPRIRLE